MLKRSSLRIASNRTHRATETALTIRSKTHFSLGGRCRYRASDERRSENTADRGVCLPWKRSLRGHRQNDRTK